MDAEFDQLYSLLGLTPACSPEELHTAFRRAVAELHPDRGRGRGAVEQAQLRDLIRLHARATEFHRRHGRLPGSNPDLRSTHGRRLAGGRSQSARSSSLRRWLIFLPLLGFVAWQLANMPY